MSVDGFDFSPQTALMYDSQILMLEALVMNNISAQNKNATSTNNSSLNEHYH